MRRRRSRRQRRGRVFLELSIQLQEQFAHHRRQRHFGRFACGPQVRVKFQQRRFLHPRQPHRAHVERPPHRRLCWPFLLLTRAPQIKLFSPYPNVISSDTLNTT